MKLAYASLFVIAASVGCGTGVDVLHEESVADAGDRDDAPEPDTGLPMGDSADPCADAQVTIRNPGEGTPLITLGAACPRSWGSDRTSHAVGFTGSGGEGPARSLQIEGCTPSGKRIVLRAELLDVGFVTKGFAQYYDGADTYSTKTKLTLDIARFEEVGGRIEGIFSAPVETEDGVVEELHGSFSVCRVPGQRAP